MSEEMKKTMKMEKPIPRKSVPVCCTECGKLFKISKKEMDTSRTFIEHGICYDCFKKTLNKMSEKNWKR